MPVTVDASRRVGKSKMRIGPTIRGYWRLVRRRAEGSRRGASRDRGPRSAIVGGGILGSDRRVPAGSGRRRTSRSTSARPTSAASSARSTSTGTGSTASTTSSCRRTIASAGSPRSSASAIASASGRRGVGFYDDARLFSMSSLREFLTFPLLPLHDRVRLARVRRALPPRSRRATQLDDVPLLAVAATKLCGRRTVERLWKPLLDSKFDGNYDDLPATYIWGRTRRMSKTRDASGREIMGWLEGGYETLIDALAERIDAARWRDPRRHERRSDRRLGGSGVDGLVVDGRLRPFDHVAVHAAAAARTAVAFAGARRAGAGRPLPLPRRDLRAPADVAQRQPLLHAQHHRPAGPADDGGRDDARRRSGARRRAHRLRGEVRRPVASRPEAAGRRRRRPTTSATSATIFPDLRDDEILDVVVQRAPAVEPVHTLGGASRLPDYHSRFRASRSRRPRTCIPRSSTARP